MNLKKLLTLIEAMRLHHWIKNILILTPALLFDWNPGIILPLFLGILAFSLMASAAYLVNDYFDQKSDREHFFNRQRPLASGRLNARNALTGALALFFASSLLSWYVNESFLVVVLAYALMNMIYNLALKKIYLVDVVTVSLFYYARVISGFLILERWPTLNEFAFFGLILLSLSFLKRTAEITGKNAHLSSGRNYHSRDAHSLLLFGLVTGFCSMAFYLGLQLQNFTLAWLAWACSCLLLIWLMRIWWIVWRDQVEYDLIWFVLKDKVTYATALGLLALHVYGLNA